jgi:hypothetical protein
LQHNIPKKNEKENMTIKNVEGYKGPYARISVPWASEIGAEIVR